MSKILVLLALLGAGCGMQPHIEKVPKPFREKDYRAGEIPELDIQDRWCEARNDFYYAGYTEYMEYQKTMGRGYVSFKNTSRVPLKKFQVKHVLAVDQRGILHDCVVDLIIMTEGIRDWDPAGSGGPAQLPGAIRKNILPRQLQEVRPLSNLEFWIHFTVMPEEIKGGEELTLAVVLAIGERSDVYKVAPIVVRPASKGTPQ